MKQWVKPLSFFSLLTFVPHSSDTIWGIFFFKASKAASTFLMSPGAAAALNLKDTTCWSLSAALAFIVRPRRAMEQRMIVMLFIVLDFDHLVEGGLHYS